ncbi:MAG: hypothetical protein JRD87_00905 [Deltaproteobacteria bacterium]|nr:hypothetical protein [Deltaproteobacteria bacterium]MBW2668442.1 hypothetical protein [Deltaproteobacteria bacterium]MBW2710965.1 hypothetical protein [Deltaproteobacteria bacterium]
MINSGIAIFYYLKMVRAAYTGVDDQVSPIHLRVSTSVLGIFFIVIIILLGIFPQGFIDFAKEAVAAVI